MMNSFTTRQKVVAVSGVALIVLFMLSFLGFLPGLIKHGSTKQVSLTMWGVYDTKDVWEPLFSAFAAQYPNIAITYKQIPYDDYENELINALAAQEGPNIFFIHHTWLPKFQDKATPMPQGKDWPTYKEYRDTFVDAAEEDLTRKRSDVYGIPLYMDTLALYYNKDLFNSAGIATPPKTWDDFQQDVQRLTQVDNEGDIIKSGAAIGTARNINRSTDILALLMEQTFGDKLLTDPDEQRANFAQSFGVVDGNTFAPGADSLRFYTSFSDPTKRSYTWNRDQHYSIDAFVEGNTAMMLNYSHHIQTVRSRSPQLNLGIARAPQPDKLVQEKAAIDYPDYFALAVSKSDKRKNEAAWQFLAFMMSKDAQSKYQIATDRPPARRDLLETLENDPDKAVFAEQALTAKSWYQPDNVAVETILADMIESVVDGTLLQEALSRAEGQVSVLMRQTK